MGKEQTKMAQKDDGARTYMISVIVSTHNRSHLLKRAIDSVLKQSYTDFELIIVDDKSTDDTQAVVGQYSDPRIRYIRRRKNFGCDTKPKNDGILASKGEYIAFLDDDNEYRPDHLAVLIKNMEADVIYGDRWLIDDTNRIPQQLGIAREFDPAFLMQRNFIDTSDVLIKRQALFDVGGFDERYKKYIDWNLWVRMSKYGKKFKHIPLVITNYHLHEDMKSNKVHTKGDTNLVFKPEWDAYDCDVELPYLNTSARTQPRVGIFSITYDRLEYTKQSFKSLEETADYPYDHLIIDNNSTDGTKQWLIDNSHWYILNDENVGISKASNQAIKELKGKYDIIVKWDNDCIGLTKGWLAKMVDLWRCNHTLALSCYVQGLVDNPGGAPRLDYGLIKKELLGLTHHLGGICHFVDAHAYDKFEWDEHSFLHGIQDMEMSQFLRFNGYTMAYLENYFVSHSIEGTAKQKQDYLDYFKRRLLEKQVRYGTKEYENYKKQL